MLKLSHVLFSTMLALSSSLAIADTTPSQNHTRTSLLTLGKNHPVLIGGEMTVNNKIAANEKIIVVNSSTKEVVATTTTDEHGDFDISTSSDYAKTLDVYAFNYPDMKTTITCYKGFCRGEANLYIISD